MVLFRFSISLSIGWLDRQIKSTRIDAVCDRGDLLRHDKIVRLLAGISYVVVLVWCCVHLFLNGAFVKSSGTNDGHN